MALAFIVTLAPTLVEAQAPLRPATELELRAAYCLAAQNLTVEAISELRDAVASVPEAKQLAEAQLMAAQSRQARLMGYVLPRLTTVAPDELLAAMRQAHLDRETRRRELATLDCQPTPEDSQRCSDWMQQNSAVSRQTRMCNDLSWFPY